MVRSQKVIISTARRQNSCSSFSHRKIRMAVHSSNNSAEKISQLPSQWPSKLYLWKISDSVWAENFPILLDKLRQYSSKSSGGVGWSSTTFKVPRMMVDCFLISICTTFGSPRCNLHLFLSITTVFVIHFLRSSYMKITKLIRAWCFL